MLHNACPFNFLLLFLKTIAVTGNYNSSEDLFQLFAKMPEISEKLIVAEGKEKEQAKKNSAMSRLG